MINVPDFFDSSQLFVVKFFVDGFEVGVGDVGVYLRRCNIAVSEHGLNAA